MPIYKMDKKKRNLKNPAKFNKDLKTTLDKPNRSKNNHKKARNNKNSNNKLNKNKIGRKRSS